MIKAICFDLDGVFFTSAGIKNFIQSIVNLGTSLDKAEYVMFKSEEMKRFKKGEMSEDDFWSFARKYWNIQNTNEEFKEILASGYSIDPLVEQAVLQSRQKGYKTCICSNNFVSRIDALENKFHFLDKFDVQIFSYKVGVTKPDKLIFEKLVQESNVEPSEIIYSDDDLEKLKGAEDLGINTFVYTDFNSFLVELKSYGVDID